MRSDEFLLCYMMRARRSMGEAGVMGFGKDSVIGFGKAGNR